MLMKPLSILALALAGIPGAALAAPDLPQIGDVHAPLAVAMPAIPDGGWFTSAELGAITTSGNTNGTSVTGKIDARHETARWSHEFIASGYFKEDEYEDEFGEPVKSRSAQRWAVEIGPGYSVGKRDNEEEERGMTVRSAAQFRWQVSPSAFFAQTVSVEKGTGNTHSVAETSLSTKINGSMQMKAGFSVRNDSDVPDDKKNTDTQTSLTMVYSF